jgi:hypothetical protein
MQCAETVKASRPKFWQDEGNACCIKVLLTVVIGSNWTSCLSAAVKLSFDEWHRPQLLENVPLQYFECLVSRVKLIKIALIFERLFSGGNTICFTCFHLFEEIFFITNNYSKTAMHSYWSTFWTFRSILRFLNLSRSCTVKVIRWDEARSSQCHMYMYEYKVYNCPGFNQRVSKRRICRLRNFCAS